FCSEFLGGLGKTTLPEKVEQDISSLRAGVNALLTYNNDVKALKMLYNLAEVPTLTPGQEGALRYWIGSIHLRDEGRLTPALEQLERARHLIPNGTDVANVHAEMAAVYNWPGPTWGRLDLARQHANEAIELAPDKVVGYLALGKIHELQEDWDRAVEFYRK